MDANFDVFELETSNVEEISWAEVRLEIHDASRLEWSVSLLLPKDEALHYTIDVELQIPSNAFVRHSPWDQLQSFTRLDGTEFPRLSGPGVTTDSLREAALSIAGKLSRIGEISEHKAKTLEYTYNLSKLIGEVCSLWQQRLDAAFHLVEDTRKELFSDELGGEKESGDLIRERRLVDEYTSIRYLELLSTFSRLAGDLLKDSENNPENCTEADIAGLSALNQEISNWLVSEISYRKKRGFLSVDPKKQDTLERYLGRSSQLKKHFQEVMFLEAQIVQVADRVYHLAAAIAAILASTFAFFMQIFLTKRMTVERQVRFGVLFVAILLGIVYALKDRLKEMAREWIRGNANRLYAQRVTKYRAPRKRIFSQDVILSARESFHQNAVKLPDPLNPGSGASLFANEIRYSHRGRIEPSSPLTLAGVERVKHVFRYDFSPIFARLDDTVKQVAVFDEENQKVNLVSAPRCYQVPVSVRITAKNKVVDESGTLIVSKRGLDRFEQLANVQESPVDSFTDGEEILRS